MMEAKEAMTIRPCTYKEAADYVNAVHRHHNASVGGKFALKLTDDDGEIHGVAMCGRPVARHYDDGLTLEINRVATDGTRNACSQLYGACVRVARAMGYKRVITYTLKTEPGSSLRASNFVYDGEAGGTHWTGERDRGQNIPAEMKSRWIIRL